MFRGGCGGRVCAYVRVFVRLSVSVSVWYVFRYKSALCQYECMDCMSQCKSMVCVVDMWMCGVCRYVIVWCVYV